MNNKQKIKKMELDAFVIKAAKNYIEIRLFNILDHDLKEHMKILEELKKDEQ